MSSGRRPENGASAPILGWLHTVELDPTQLEGLIALSRTVHAAVESDREERALMGSKELAAYKPIYAQLIRAFSGEGSLSAEDLTQAAADLRVARQAVWGDADPHRARFERMRDVLKSVQSWVALLSEDQRNELANARFFCDAAWARSPAQGTTKP